MSSNIGTQAHYLTPIHTSQPYDNELENILNHWIQGVSGLAADYVRSRRDPTEPYLLLPDIDWCTLSINSFETDTNLLLENQTAESAELWRNETLECLMTFYGPASQRIATGFRDGLILPQNNNLLKDVGLSLGNTKNITCINQVVDKQWVRRCDITVYLRRKVSREYGIKSLVVTPVHIFGE